MPKPIKRPIKTTPKQSQGWNQRKRALQFAHDRAIEYAGRRSPALPQDMRLLQIDALESLLEKLNAFGSDHYSFFRSGLLENPDYYFDWPSDFGQRVPEYTWLESDASYLDTFILQTVLYRLSQDLLIIDQAIDQRMRAAKANPGSQSAAPDSPPEILKRFIRTSDWLANNALGERAREILGDRFHLDPDSAIITYQRLAPSIRVIPYSNIGLLAVPITGLTDSGVSATQLAIPHEVGHYLYWNALEIMDDGSRRPLRKGLIDRLLSGDPQLNPNFDSLEEVFADVVGALIGGPAAGISLQEMMTGESGAYFRFDDGHHPIPALRPLIYAHVIGKAGKRFVPVADELSDRWYGQHASSLAKNVVTGISSSVVTETDYPGFGPKIEEADSSVLDRWETTREYVDVILEMLNPLPPVSPWYIEAESALLSYEAFLNLDLSEELADQGQGGGGNTEPEIDWRNRIRKVLAEQLVGEAGEDTSWLPTAPAQYAAPAPADGQSADIGSNGSIGESARQIPPEVWLAILDAGGWITGPSGGSNAH